MPIIWTDIEIFSGNGHSYMSFSKTIKLIARFCTKQTSGEDNHNASFIGMLGHFN